MKNTLTIKALSEASGIHLETIRFYEKSGLITPAKRADNGYRQFTQQQLDELKFIKTCRSLGFDLGKIKTLLRLQANPQTDCTDANALATQHLHLIEEKIQELIKIRDLLQGMSQCDNHHVEDCLVINTLKKA